MVSQIPGGAPEIPLPQPGTIPPQPILLDPVEIEASFKVKSSPEYTQFKQALQENGSVRYQGRMYTPANLDRFVDSLVHQANQGGAPLEVVSRADFVARQVKATLRGLTETLKQEPHFRLGDFPTNPSPVF